MNHLGDLLSAYLDGELESDQTERVAGHLYECATCRRRLDEIAEVRTALRSLPMVEPPIPLLPAARRRTWVTAAASVAAAALAVGLVVTPADSPALDLDTMAGRHSARVAVDPGISTIRGPLGGR